MSQVAYFFNTVHLLPKNFRLKHGGAKLASCTGRHLTSLRLSAGPKEVVNHLWKGHQTIFYVHSCITFALSEFRWGSLDCSGLLQWIEVQKGLKTTGLNASVKITIDIWTHSPQYCCIA